MGDNEAGKIKLVAEIGKKTFNHDFAMDEMNERLLNNHIHMFDRYVAIFICICISFKYLLLSLTRGISYYRL